VSRQHHHLLPRINVTSCRVRVTSFQVNATESSLYIVDVPMSLQPCNTHYKRCHGNSHAFCVLLRYLYSTYICRCLLHATHLAPQVECRCFCTILTKYEVRKQIFVQDPNIKLHENPPSGRRADTCGQTDRQGRADTHNEASRRLSRLTRRRLSILPLTDNSVSPFYRTQYRTHLSVHAKPPFIAVQL